MRQINQSAELFLFLIAENDSRVTDFEVKYLKCIIKAMHADRRVTRLDPDSYVAFNVTISRLRVIETAIGFTPTQQI